MSIFAEITIVLLLATIVSYGLRLLKQPLIVGYILTGIIAGPAVLNLIHHHEVLEVFSQFGIVILLFLVGLHLSPKVIGDVGKTSLILGLGQILFTSIFGFLIALGLGWELLEALFIAIGLTFSSTIIVLKILTDKKEVDTLYGKISIGFLLVQDIVAALILIFFAALSGSSGQPTWFIITFFLIRVGLVMLLYWLSTKYLLPRLLNKAAESTELLFLFSLTWAITFASVFYYLGLSVEIGALIAGVALSTSDFSEEISSRLTPLRDFFIIVFFVSLGSEMVLSGASQFILPVLLFSVFVLIGNPLIVMFLMNQLGYQRKTGFLAGLTVAQISEFSLILASLANAAGFVSQPTLTMITLVGLVTIAGSTYLMLYSDSIFPFIEKYISIIEFNKNTSKKRSQSSNYDVIIFGYRKMNQQFLSYLDNQGYSVAIVDFDPEVSQELKEKDIPHFFGDVANVEFLETLPLEKAKLVVASIANSESNTLLAKHTAKRNPKTITIIFSDRYHSDLYDAGATYVVAPMEHGVKHVSALLSRHGFAKTAYSNRADKYKTKLATQL